MKKIILPLIILTTFTACKKDTKVQDEKLATLIKNNDVKGLQAYKDHQKFKVDSLNKVMSQIDTKLTSLGINGASGVVSLLKLADSTFVHNVDIQGNVTTDQDVTMTPQFNGVLTLFVKEGQRVGKGQVIGKIADGGLSDQFAQANIQVATANAQLQQVKSNVALTKIAYDKQATLWKQKIGSEFQYLQAKTNYESGLKQIAASQSQVGAAKKQSDYVKANLAKTSLIAPFSGVVDKIMTHTGQIVNSTPATEILKLISLGTMRVEAKVPENYLATVKQGTNVQVFFPTLNKSIKSRINIVGNYIDPTNRTFTIQIPVANEGNYIKPNLLAQVKIQDYINPNSIQVPAQYIYNDATNKSYVFVATRISGKDAYAKKVMVQLGQKSENSVEINQGLKSGDVLITDGSKSLVDGQKVNISQ